MLLQCHETCLEKLSELGEFLRFFATQQVNKLLCQLEGGLLEFEAFAREAGQEESKIDVNHMALSID